MNDSNWSRNVPCWLDELPYEGPVQYAFVLVIMATSVLLCLATVALVCVQKLHKILVYRLAMYQVLSAMLFSVLGIIYAVLAGVSVAVTDFVLIALLLGSSFIKLMFTVWISIHLFALAVFHKNLQRLELLYVVSSLLIPLAVTAGLTYTNVTYVESLGASASYNREEVVYVIIFAVLILISLLMVAMGIILCHRACRKRTAILSEYDKQHKKVLCEMLPLLSYPIVFLLFTTPIFASTVCHFEKYWSNDYQGPGPMTLPAMIFAPFWSLTTSLLLLFHLCVVRCMGRKKVVQINRNARQQYNEEGSVTVNETTRLCNDSNTHFSAPTEG